MVSLGMYEYGILQAFAVELVTIAIDFIPFAEFVTFAIEFVAMANWQLNLVYLQ